MDVNDLIDEYFSQDDSDLKYMTLKKPVKFDDIQDDLIPYFSNLVVPILLDEPSPEIVTLLSAELLPELFIKQFIRFPQLDSLIYLTLINYCGEIKNHKTDERQIIFVQCLKNIFHKIKNVHINERYINNFRVHNESIIFEFIKKGKFNNLCEKFPSIYRETLNSLIELYYDGKFKIIPVKILTEVLNQTANDDSFDPTTKELLINITRYTSSINLSEVSGTLNCIQLGVISRCWYRFNKIPIIYFKHLNHDTFDMENLEIILNIINNLSPFLTMRPFSQSNEPLVAEEVTIELICKLKLIKQNIENNRGEIQDDKDDILMENDDFSGPEEEDLEQQAYMNELMSDGEEFLMEGSNNGDEHINNSDDTLDEMQKNYVHNIKLVDEILNSINKSKENENENQSFSSDVAKLIKDLQDSTELKELQQTVQSIEQLLKTDSDNEPWAENTNNGNTGIGNALTPFERTTLYQALLPHLHRNKEFVNIIKVGNMKQKMDEGITLRMMIYNIFNLSSAILPYSIACCVIQDIVQYSVKERDTAIQNQIVSLFDRLLGVQYDNICGLDEEWYFTQVIARLQAHMETLPEGANPAEAADAVQRLYRTVATIENSA